MFSVQYKISVYDKSTICSDQEAGLKLCIGDLDGKRQGAGSCSGEKEAGCCS